MWVANITLKYDASVMGRRCHRYMVTSKGLILPCYPEGDDVKYPYFETIAGDEKQISFLTEDLHNDPSISDINHQDSMLFFIKTLPAAEPHPRKISSAKIFFTKPILTDKKGQELWTVGSWSEKSLKEFIVKIKKEHLEVESDTITQEPLDQVYSQQIMPHLTVAQKKAIELAAQEGYYHYPRKVELAVLAKQSGIALSTYREHLRKAERKVMEDMLGKAKTVAERLTGDSTSPSQKPQSDPQNPQSQRKRESESL